MVTDWGFLKLPLVAAEGFFSLKFTIVITDGFFLKFVSVITGGIFFPEVHLNNGHLFMYLWTFFLLKFFVDVIKKIQFLLGNTVQ